MEKESGNARNARKARTRARERKGWYGNVEEMLRLSRRKEKKEI